MVPVPVLAMPVPAGGSCFFFRAGLPLGVGFTPLPGPGGFGAPVIVVPVPVAWCFVLPAGLPAGVTLTLPLPVGLVGPVPAVGELGTVPVVEPDFIGVLGGRLGLLSRLLLAVETLPGEFAREFSREVET